MYTLVVVLDEGLKFQNIVFISFPQFVYCSRDEVYFLNYLANLPLIALDNRYGFSIWFKPEITQLLSFFSMLKKLLSKVGRSVIG